MSCDGLYLISLKGRQPQPAAATREPLAVGPCRPPSCIPPPFPLLCRAVPCCAWSRSQNQTDNTGWKAWRCSQSCLGVVHGPRRMAQGRMTGIGSAQRQLQQQQQIRQPKKPFPCLPCFWSGRRAWDAFSSLATDYSIQYFVPSLAAASNNILSLSLSLSHFLTFHHAVVDFSASHYTAG